MVVDIETELEILKYMCLSEINNENYKLYIDDIEYEVNSDFVKCPDSLEFRMLKNGKPRDVFENRDRCEWDYIYRVVYKENIPMCFKMFYYFWSWFCPNFKIDGIERDHRLKKFIENIYKMEV